MIDTLQKEGTEKKAPSECPECQHDTVRHTVRVIVSYVDQYKAGEAYGTTVQQRGEPVHRTPWQCTACKHTWYDPPRKLIVRIEPDEDPMSPRDDETLGIMVCFHKRYSLGDETDLKASMFEEWEALEEHLREEEAGIHVLPLYLYDHSGITMSTSPFDCSWDSSQVGFIYTTAKQIAELGVVDKNIETQLKAEVTVYDQFLMGDVWGYIIEDEKGEHVDSCWGFFGRENVEAEAAKVLKRHV